MYSYRPTIGLEIHAELSTRTKMFCACVNAPHEAEPNTNVCPVCMAHPGTLPVPNKEAVQHVLRVGASVGGTLADFSEFDRKSYFYPDIPKGYQISQYEFPLVQGGALADVAITRIHLEEDTARSSHDATAGTSSVDFNRAGVPLMELVTEPVIHDAQTAGAFARELQLLLRTLGASHANLEKGEMRIEANISVSANDAFGTKVEVKNLNSFRSVERAIAYEVDRQIACIESGGVVVQETRGWDENKQQTFSQRLKEGSADYRYFPEPDIPKLRISDVPEWHTEVLVSGLPELPWMRRARYTKLGLQESSADFLTATVERGAFFDRVLESVGVDASDIAPLIANYLVSDVAGWYTKSGKDEYEGLSAESFGELIVLLYNGKLSSRAGKDVLALMLEGNTDSPEKIASNRGLLQVSDPEVLVAVVQEVIAGNEDVVAEYRAGKQSSLQFLVGQSIKATRGAGNPAVIQQLLLKELG